jgi:uncharacterized alkaline shock family protein YloU
VSAPAAPPPATAEAASAGAPLPEPADRGRTTIADRVVEKIAAQAAAEVDLATGGPRRLLGLGGQSDRPQVDARVDWPIATVDVVMAVAWPAPVAAVSDQVRRRIEDRLTTLAGVRTAGIDIRVSALTLETTTGPRVR